MSDQAQFQVLHSFDLISVPVDADGRPLDCPHARQEARRRTARNGARHYVYQCLGCGGYVSAVRKDEFAARQAAERNAPFDEELQREGQERRNAAWQAYGDRRQREWERQRAQENAAWWTDYNAYLASWEWQERRSRVLARDDYRCQARLDGCRLQAEQVHHLTYDHLGNEPLFDLISVCSPCHDGITAMDRERRERRERP